MANSIPLASFSSPTSTSTRLTTIANTGFGATSTYTAVFTDASGLAEGDDVRVRGVKVGRVTSLAVLDDSLAAVDLEVESDRRLPAAVNTRPAYWSTPVTSARCGSAAAPPRICSQSASPPPIMSATATAPEESRCASS